MVPSRPGSVLAVLLACMIHFGPAPATHALPDNSEDPVGRDVLLRLSFVFDDTVDVVAPRELHLGGPPDSLQIRYFGTHSLTDFNLDVTRAVVVVHGTLRNADDYFQDILDAADAAGNTTALIIAPQFLTEGDIVAHDLPDDMLFWEYMGWRQGDQSSDTPEHPRPWQISSYAVADSILYRIASNNPNLEQIVLCGHSAGGQFANRFAAGSQTHELVTGQFGVPIRYIVSNPSTYVYLTEDRWIEGSTYEFAVPEAEAIAGCPEYNDYKYGLDNTNAYMSIGNELIRSQYSQRQVVYLLGAVDDDPNSFYLDRSCPAIFQGIHRLQRGILYLHHLVDLYGPGIVDLHAMQIVAGIGHDHHGMFTSDCGVSHLFDHGNCPAVPLSPTWAEVTTAPLVVFQGHSIAWGDHDGDGDPDLYVSGEGDSNTLARNEGNLSFLDVTTAPLDDDGFSLSSAWGDYDNDGDLDLYLANYSGDNKLFRNEGDGEFSDVTTGALGSGDDVCDSGWVDFDLDGDLDLCFSRDHGRSNRLLRNDGAGGFTNVTSGPLAGQDTTRGLAWGDYDLDGDMDLYLSNSGPSRLLRNDGTEEFVDVTSGPLGDDGDGSSAAWGDHDGDGDIDLYLSIRDADNKLLRNDGAGAFTDVTTGPLGDDAANRSSAWADYDNDGDLDLYLANSDDRDRLLRNDGQDGFVDVATFPLGDTGPNFCAAWADYDLDGDVDLYVANRSESNRLFRNISEPTNHWFHVDLLGSDSNTFGVGATVRILAGGRSQIRQVGSDDAGYQSQSSLTAEFGLGAATILDSLIVMWPSGIVQGWAQLTVDLRILIAESGGTGMVQVSPARPPAFTLHQNYPNPFNPRTTFYYELSEPAPIALHVYDGTGRVVRVLRPWTNAPAGKHPVTWDGRDERGQSVPSGVYFYRLEGPGETKSRRMILLR